MRHEVKVLGPWEFRGGPGGVTIPAGQLRLLLTLLALPGNQTVGVDTLVEQLWPERPPARPRDTVHVYVGRLRKLLGPDMIGTQSGAGYQLNVVADALDLHRFRRLLRQASTAGTADEELAMLRSALGLWRGTPFADLYSTWLDRSVLPRLTEEWFTATCRRFELELRNDQPEPLIAELQDLAKRFPTRELLWRHLITALYQAGRRGEALAAYQQVRATLRDELGLEPGDALIQLERTILRDGSAAIVVEPASAEFVPRQLPHDIARFTGRDEELATLDGLLPDTPGNGQPTIVLIDGAPGVGKTTLAVHWAHRVAQRYPDAQVYLNLCGYGPREPLRPASAAEKILRALGVAGARIPADLDERCALVRTTLSGQAALILLDNARNTDQVRALLPGTTGLVIVTSRSQLRGLSIRDGAHRVTLRPLPPRQSVELLAATVGSRAVAADPSAAAALVELCDRLPLALAIVAERAQEPGSLAKVLAELENEQARLDTLDPGDDIQDTGLRAALSWSYGALGADAATMFRKLGLYPANDIEVRTAAALAGEPVPRARAALEALSGAHLIEHRRPDRYELHDLIRLYANELATHDDAADRYATVRRVLDWYLHAAGAAAKALIPHRHHHYLAPYEPVTPPPTFASAGEATTWFEQEYDCLRSVTAWAATHGFAGHAWRIAISMTTYFHHTIPGCEGIEFYTAAIRAAHVAGEPVGEACAHHSLATIYQDLDDLDSAIAHIQRSLTCFQLASHPIGEAAATGNLALTYAWLGDGTSARRHAERGLTLWRGLRNPRGIAANLGVLGLAHTLAGEYDQAVRYCQQALHTIDQLGDIQMESWIQHYLAQAHRHRHDYPNATRAFRRAITLHRAQGNRRWEAIVLADFATMLTEAGHPTIARALRETALHTLTEFADPRAKEIETTLAGS